MGYMYDAHEEKEDTDRDKGKINVLYHHHVRDVSEPGILMVKGD